MRKRVYANGNLSIRVRFSSCFSSFRLGEVLPCFNSTWKGDLYEILNHSIFDFISGFCLWTDEPRHDGYAEGNEISDARRRTRQHRPSGFDNERGSAEIF